MDLIHIRLGAIFVSQLFFQSLGTIRYNTNIDFWYVYHPLIYRRDLATIQATLLYHMTNDMSSKLF